MHIAFAIPRLIRHAGGTEQATAALITELARRHQVTIFSSEVVGLEGVPYRLRRVPVISRPVVLEYLSFVLLCTLLRGWLRLTSSERYDILHSPGVNVLAADMITAHWCQAGAERRSRSLTLDGGTLRGELRKLARAVHRRVVLTAERAVYRRRAVRLVACVAPLVRDEIVQLYGRDPRRTICLPNGVDLDHFSPARRAALRAEARAELGLDAADTLLLSVGGDWERKGIGTLIEAVAALPQARLLVVGHGDAERYRARAAAHGCADRVWFRPNSADVMPFYAAADAYLSPTRYEPFGLTPLEALASGLATAVSRDAGVSAWLHDGEDALLIDDPADVGAVRSAMRLLIEQPALRERLALNGRQRAERFSWAAVAAAYERHYQELCGRPGQAQIDAYGEGEQWA